MTALAFSTVSDEEIRHELQRTECAFIDLFGSNLDTVERVLHVNATHGVGACTASVTRGATTCG